MRNLVAALDHVFRNVIDHLRAIVRAGFGPAGRVARRFHCVANVFAIAQRRFAQQFALAPVHRERITGIGPRLFAADVLLHCAIDSEKPARTANPSSSSGAASWRPSPRLRQRVQPLRRQIFQHALASAFAPVARFAIAAESARRVELVGASSPTPRPPSPAKQDRAPR